MFPASSGILFFGVEGAKPIAWDAIHAIPEIVMDDEDFAEEQSKIFATMRGNSAVTMECRINKKGIENLMGVIKGFKIARGPTRKRMIRRAKKMQANYIYEYEFIKEGDEYVNERGQIRLVLQ